MTQYVVFLVALWSACALGVSFLIRLAIRDWRRWRAEKVAALVVLPPAKRKRRKHPPRKSLAVQFYKGPLSFVPWLLYLDQDCQDYALVSWLEAHGFKVTTTNAADNRHNTDAQQLKFAARQRMVLITRDRDFEKLHKAGYQHAGILHVPHGHEWHQEILRICLTLVDEVAA